MHACSEMLFILTAYYNNICMILRKYLLCPCVHTYNTIFLSLLLSFCTLNLIGKHFLLMCFSNPASCHFIALAYVASFVFLPCACFAVCSEQAVSKQFVMIAQGLTNTLGVPLDITWFTTLCVGRLRVAFWDQCPVQGKYFMPIKYVCVYMKGLMHTKQSIKFYKVHKIYILAQKCYSERSTETRRVMSDILSALLQPYLTLTINILLEYSNMCSKWSRVVEVHCVVLECRIFVCMKYFSMHLILFVVFYACRIFHNIKFYIHIFIFFLRVEHFYMHVKWACGFLNR